MRRPCVLYLMHMPAIYICHATWHNHKGLNSTLLLLERQLQLLLLADAVCTGLQPRAPVFILSLPQMPERGRTLAVPAGQAMLGVQAQALLLDQAVCLLQASLQCQHSML